MAPSMTVTSGVTDAAVPRESWPAVSGPGWSDPIPMVAMLWERPQRTTACKSIVDTRTWEAWLPRMRSRISWPSSGRIP